MILTTRVFFTLNLLSLDVRVTLLVLFCVSLAVDVWFLVNSGAFTPLHTPGKGGCPECSLVGTTLELKVEDQRSWHSVV